MNATVHPPLKVLAHVRLDREVLAVVPLRVALVQALIRHRHRLNAGKVARITFPDFQERVKNLRSRGCRRNLVEPPGGDGELVSDRRMAGVVT